MQMSETAADGDFQNLVMKNSGASAVQVPAPAAATERQRITLSA